MDDFTDETMLSADMGLYYDFTVNEATSRVSGYGEDGKISCPGLIGTDSNGDKIPGLNAGRSKCWSYNLHVSFLAVPKLNRTEPLPEA